MDSEATDSPEDIYVKKVVDTVKNVSIPNITNAYVSHVSQDGNKLTITTKWSQKNYELSKDDKFSIIYYYDKCSNCLEKASPPLETYAILIEAISPSLEQRAVIKKHVNKTTTKDEYVFELWSNTLNKRIKTINLTSLDKHGKVHSNGMFRRLSWSQDETKLVYVAERKKAKFCGFFETSDKSSEKSKPVQGGRYEYEGNWGEQLTEITNTVLCILTLSDDSVEIVEGIPESLSPLQPVFGPGNSLVFAALESLPFRLGFIYCQNRECGIYLLQLDEDKKSAVELSKCSGTNANFNPQMNKAKTKVVFTQSKISGTGDPHRSSNSLMIYDFNEGTTKLLCSEFTHGTETVPLYVWEDRDYNFWLPDGIHIAVTNTFEGRSYICIVHTETGLLKSMTECSDTFSVYNGVIFACYQKLTSQTSTLMLIDGSSNPENPVIAKELEVIDEDVESDSIVDEHGLVSFYLMPKGCPTVDHRFPLVVTPHGGPHGTYTNDYSVFARLFCKLGYAVLLVNFRGSIGFSDSSLRSLPGNVGTQDVSDVQAIVNKFISLQNKFIDKENIFVTGGSHGGFLSAHLIGQFPTFYRAACLRNPVIEISSMSVTSDIPDWAYFESGVGYTQDVIPTSGAVTNMLMKSPIIYLANIKAPVLLCIGGKDVRVPPSQGMHFFRLLKANKKVVKMLYYPDDNHPLSNVETNGDHVINICKWFYEHGSHSR